ncbi:UbiH/UbiF/VisC/COQ6 family ubiquinone biosynthesis hydroxylase [Pseudoroseicyclus sp. CXY001]|uniref:UbiH/UbiF/VisC/COQ6 family ubiquinone biosynthesis hydroxylase n=1 Tax=Pseudoroseicyclus sp. CXY001 TaxID=3242492 RepID=UPI00358DA8B1
MDNAAPRRDNALMQRALIIGGGLNGPALALALAKAGLEPVVLDALPAETRAAPGFDGRAYALAHASVRLLKALGIWGAVAAEAQPIEEIKVTDGVAGEGAGPFWLHFERGALEEGPMGQMVEDRHLRPALLAGLEAAGIEHRAGVRVVAQQAGPGTASVTLEDGTELTGTLIVGADGRRSGTAERAGLKRRVTDYGQSAVTCAVAHERPHEGVAHQFFMPGGPLAILPLAGNRSSIVWSETTARAEALMAMDEPAFLAALRPAFGDHLGKISLASKRFAYPLGLSLAERFIAPRVALVGDAAHGLHPLAGQGLNAGLRDVAALAEVLSAAAQRGEDIGAAATLARYQSWRGFDTQALALATDGFNRLFSNDNPLLRAARGLGLGLVSAVPGLRRSLMREAAGLTGDLPPLMR